ncbi:MAG: hypothetical protein ABL964_09900 [Steroidobacteraceae bacterium]
MNLSTARTFLTNFSVPCLWVALAGAVAGMGLGAYGMHRWDAGKVAEAKLALTEYRAAVATQTAGAIQVALDGQRAAYAAEQAQRNQIETALAAIPDATAVQIEGLRRDLTKQLKTSLAAPEWSCLRQPLPADVSSLFQRP